MSGCINGENTLDPLHVGMALRTALAANSPCPVGHSLPYPRPGFALAV